MKWASGLDAFSLYPLARGCSAMPCRTTDELEAPIPRSSRTKGTFSSGTNAPPPKSNTPVSRRCKPSSRSLLMGEQPHPWQLIHHQDRKNRHRSSKPPGRYVPPFSVNAFASQKGCVNSCWRRLSYPRGNFSLITHPHKGG